MVKTGIKKGQCKNTLMSDLLFSHRLQKKPAVPLCYLAFILIGKSFGTERRLHFVPQRSKSILEAGAALKTSASPSLQMPAEITSVQRRGVAGKPSGFQWDNILLLFKKASSTSACLNPVRPEHRLKAKHMLKSFPKTDTCEESLISWNMGFVLWFIPSSPPRISRVWNAKNPSKLIRRCLCNYMCIEGTKNSF